MIIEKIDTIEFMEGCINLLELNKLASKHFKEHTIFNFKNKEFIITGTVQNNQFRNIIICNFETKEETEIDIIEFFKNASDSGYYWTN